MAPDEVVGAVNITIDHGLRIVAGLDDFPPDELAFSVFTKVSTIALILLCRASGFCSSDWRFSCAEVLVDSAGDVTFEASPDLAW